MNLVPSSRTRKPALSPANLAWRSSVEDDLAAQSRWMKKSAELHIPRSRRAADPSRAKFLLLNVKSGATCGRPELALLKSQLKRRGQKAAALLLTFGSRH